MLQNSQNDRAGARVLVVDDDRLIREMTRDALVREGFHVEVAASGTEALGILERSGPFDVVLTDLSMPEMDGLELMEKIKRAQPRTDVIVLTGYASLESALQALRLGAADYLRKPVEGPEIVYGVKRTILRRQLVAENESLRGWLQAFESSRVLTSSLETQDILPLAMDILLQLLRRERAVGRIVYGDPRLQDGLCVRGFSTEVARDIRDQVHAGKLFELPTSDRPLQETAEGLRKAVPSLEIEDELLVLPMRLAGQPVGGVWILSGGRPFRDEEIERARLVAAQGELALINAEKFLQARERAFVDDVTDLYNARYLLAALDREVSRAHRYGLEVSVLFLDLDHFKHVNDRHGHLVGSGVLRELGKVLQGCVRSIDTVGRYGGDEFAVLLVDTGISGALQVAQRIRRTVAAATFHGERDLDLHLTLSGGAATYPIHGMSWQELLDRSDKAMYLAKTLGRDRICSADDLRKAGSKSGKPRVL
jgi:diguanylate cyclase (GGDEF)-like protein